MRILIAEDERDLNRLLVKKLTAESYSVDACTNGEEALDCLACARYDAVILDIMMPKMDGLEVLKTMRRKKDTTPVLLLTARDSVEDRVRGLDLGADDYLVKPYAPGELLARIRAVTRRPGKLEPTRAKAYSNISLDPEKRELTGPSGMVQLSKRESALMEYLIRNAGQILTRGMILSYIWGPDSEVEEGNLDNYVYFLRRRLKSVNGAVQIKTIHGTGYRLEAGGNP